MHIYLDSVFLFNVQSDLKSIKFLSDSAGPLLESSRVKVFCVSK